MGEDVHLPFGAWLIAPNLMISGCIHFLQMSACH